MVTRARLKRGFRVAAIAVLVSSCAAACGAKNGGVGTSASSGSPLNANTPAELATAGGEGSAGHARAPAPADALPPGAERFVAAMRRSDWQTAYDELTRLPESERKRPELRFALGVAARYSGHADVSVAALAGLEAELPVLAHEIREHWAHAAAVTGPYDAAAAILLASERAENILTAARAMLRAEKHAEARMACDKAVRAAQKSKRRDAEREARVFRAELMKRAGDKHGAAAELTWALRAQPSRGKEFLAELEGLGAAMSVDDRIAMLEANASRATLDATLAELDGIAKAHPAKRDAVVLARARALRKSHESARAVAELERAAKKLPKPAAAEARYQAARALASSGRLDEAIAHYQALAAAGGAHGERAAVRRAELLLQAGRYVEAAAAHGQLARRFKKSPKAASASYGRALALLSGGQAKSAKKELALLKKGAHDPSHAATLAELEGLAALRAGDRAGAAAIWRDVVRTQPLSWAALCAHARLVELGGGELPPLIAPRDDATPGPLVVTMPEAPRLLASLGLDAAAEARLRAMEDEVARLHPGRENEALCTLYAELAPARRRHQIGTRGASYELLRREPGAGQRWAWQCAYPGPWRELVLRAETERLVPHGLVHAVMRQESAFEPLATSPVGARGLMQLMPGTAREAAGELSLLGQPPLLGQPALPGQPDGASGHSDDYFVRPDVNIAIGAFYLGKLLRTFDGSLPLAVASYNAGPHAVSGWLAGSDRDADVWVARIPYRETRHYVAHVLSNLARYEYLSGGVEAVSRVSLRLPARSSVKDGDY